MKNNKLRELKDSEIIEQIDSTKEEIRKHRFQYAVARSLENTKVINVAKRKIAFLKTIQRERVLGINQK